MNSWGFLGWATSHLAPDRDHILLYTQPLTDINTDPYKSKSRTRAHGMTLLSNFIYNIEVYVICIHFCTFCLRFIWRYQCKVEDTEFKLRMQRYLWLVMITHSWRHLKDAFLFRTYFVCQSQLKVLMQLKNIKCHTR